MSALSTAPPNRTNDRRVSAGAMLTISPAVPDDLPALLDLTRLCIVRMREQGIDQWDDIYPDEALFARDVAAGTVHLMRDDEAVVGCITVDTSLDPLWDGMDWSRPDSGSFGRAPADDSSGPAGTGPRPPPDEPCGGHRSRTRFSLGAAGCVSGEPRVASPLRIAWLPANRSCEDAERGSSSVLRS